VSGDRDGTVRVWDAECGAVVGDPLRGHDSSVASVAVTAGGTRIVSGSWDGTMRVWDAETGAAVGELL
jgi:WD40 repeat protein